MDRAPASALEESGRIQQLLDELHELSPAPAWERIEELIRRLLDLQGRGFERLLAEARACGADGVLDARIGQDELLSSVLLLHGLHPVAPLDRIERALEELRPRLAAHGARAELIGIQGDVARVRVWGQGDAAATVRRAVEDAAPDLASVEIEAPPGPLVALRVSGGLP